ncbi:MAG TPA: redoxin domain-containing protein [Verrucomicrobiae bacterium]|nr:redoxin domain-containing protein [Verrucomicrobiae bacterium]
MNKNDISAILTAVGVISLIVGFGIYFNFYNNTSHSYQQQQQKQLEKSVDQSIVKSGNVINIKLNKTEFLKIDKKNLIKAPELTGISGYINTGYNNNSKPITLSQYKGKVVLVDFWTYTCINCIRTIPHLNSWYDRYSDKGFTIIGVHSPEFEFEKNLDNVKNAVTKFGIKYPVVLDSDHKTWGAYQNKYWPRDYLIDSQGYVRDDHIGEGGYNDTEKAIQTLLAERAALDNKTEISFNMSKGVSSYATKSIPRSIANTDFTQVLSPEIYLGYSFARSSLGNPEGFQPGKIIDYNFSINNITASSAFSPNVVYLDGKWKNNQDNMELVSDTGKIFLTYYAKSVNIVASGNGQKATIVQTAPQNAADDSKNNALDIDKNNNSVIINKQRLYNIGLYKDYGIRLIEIDIHGNGFQLYTFTFG